MIDILNSAEGAPDLFSAASMLPTNVHESSERPDTARPALTSMREAAELPEALFGGNRRMRKEADRWLKKEEEESDKNWEIRVSRATCFPYYRDTVCDLAARPFGREVGWEDAEPGPDFAEFLRDADGTGRSLTVLARDLLVNSIHRGMDHILVNVEASGTGETAEKTANRRVYATRIDALSMLDIRDEPDETGRKRVTYCRFVTVRTNDTDSFKQDSEVVIVELESPITTMNQKRREGYRREWTFNEKERMWVGGEPQAYNPGKSGIPLFTHYTQQVAHYAAEPLLEDLAWVNLAHFQSRADHAHVMRVARLITLVTLGWRDSPEKDPNAKKKKLKLGPLSRISNANHEAQVFFLEPSGKSIELSFRDMEQLDAEAKRLGARHHNSKTGNITATATTSDDRKSNTNLQTFCVRLDVVLRQVLEAVAEWKNTTLPENVQPRVDKEFHTTGSLEEGARALALIKDALSTEQLIREAIRFGILRPDFPVEENLEQLEKQRSAIEEAIARAAGGADDDLDDDPPANDPADPDGSGDGGGDE